MSLFRLGKETEARELFGKAAAKMKPLPADENQPLANGVATDDLIVWVAYKEAQSLLNPKSMEAQKEKESPVQSRASE